MINATTMKKKHWKVVVCGSKFGRVYMSALADKNFDMELVGILATGSERSRSCAAKYNVPLYTDVSQLPADVDAACVAISSEFGGGVGTALALELMKRGISILQEHPMHHDELLKVFKASREYGVVHRMNTLYPYVYSVRQFLAAAEVLLRKHQPVYIDGACSIQLKFSFLDIVGRLLGRLRPWEFQVLPSERENSKASVPFRSIQGLIGSVPVSIRLQNQLHSTDPDNHCHLYHSLTIGTAVGSLSLVDTHGPVIWRPRPHIPQEIQNDESPEDSQDSAIDLETVTTIANSQVTWRAAMMSEWPAAIRLALNELRDNVDGGLPKSTLQYYLSLMQLTHELDAKLGPPEILYEASPNPQSADDLIAAVAAIKSSSWYGYDA